MDPFETLGLPRAFDLDRKALEQRHRELSRALHPDRHTGSLPAARRVALANAVLVNEAFRTLRDPVKRAEALFRLSGALAAETQEPKPAPSFLMEMMEDRETLAEAKGERDRAKISALKRGIEARRSRAEARLAKVFAPSEPAASETDLAAALPILGELRFYARFLEEVDRLEDELSGDHLD